MPLMVFSSKLYFHPCISGSGVSPTAGSLGRAFFRLRSCSAAAAATAADHFRPGRTAPVIGMRRGSLKSTAKTVHKRAANVSCILLPGTRRRGRHAPTPRARRRELQPSKSGECATHEMSASCMRCCLCGVGITKGSERVLPPDESGDIRLPPASAQEAANNNAPSTG